MSGQGQRILLDANALWSPALRDTLLRAAEHRLFQPLWSDEILEELVRTVLAKRSQVQHTRINRTIALMRSTFAVATIIDYAGLIPQLTNHPGDRHVLAAAISGRADSIVTWNHRHFLPTAERDYGIEVISPDMLLTRLWERDATFIRQLLLDQGAALHPPQSLASTLHSLERAGASRFARLVRETTDNP